MHAGQWEWSFARARGAMALALAAIIWLAAAPALAAGKDAGGTAMDRVTVAENASAVMAMIGIVCAF